MTRGGRLLLARLATWMDGSAAVTPRRLQIPPLRSSGAPVGTTRGGRLLLARLATWMDEISSGYSAKTAGPSTPLLWNSGRDDKGRAVSSRKVNDLVGRSAAVTPRRLQIPPLRSSGAPVGMTRGGRLLLARLATGMDGSAAVTRENCRSLHSAPPELRSG